MGPVRSVRRCLAPLVLVAVVASATAAGAGRRSDVLFSDPLSEPTRLIEEFDDDVSSASFEDGKLLVRAKPSDQSTYLVPAFPKNGRALPPNVRIEVDVTLGPNALVGVICRHRKGVEYEFLLSEDGVLVDKYVDGEFTTLHESAVPLEPVNHLVAECRGPRTTRAGDTVTARYSVNGTAVDVSDSDAPLGNGGVGIFWEAYDDTIPSFATFSNLEVTRLAPLPSG